jgi:hypothetical protein
LLLQALQLALHLIVLTLQLLDLTLQLIGLSVLGPGATGDESRAREGAQHQYLPPAFVAHCISPVVNSTFE